MVQKIKTSSERVSYSERIAKVLMTVSAAVLVLSPIPLVAQNGYDAQIDATQSEISTYKQEQVRLANYAASLETALAQLDTQLADVNNQIRQNQEEYEALTNELLAREADVKEKSGQLGAVLRQAYIDNQISPLEMIASSKSVSDYMDYYESRDRLQAELQKNLDVLKQAKLKVFAQREEVDEVLRDGKAMRDTLNEKRAEQAELLKRTRGQQEAYENLIAERNANVTELRAQQLGANQTYFATGQLIEGAPNNGGYPANLNNAAQDSLVDPWGMYNRECVSYTAWKVHQSGRHMPYWGGRGNANQWPSSAEADGIPIGGTPKKGAVAIAFIGPYGHAMYVEEILDDGRIRISEYNYFVNGTYTERIIDGAGLTYIYFEK